VSEQDHPELVPFIQRYLMELGRAHISDIAFFWAWCLLHQEPREPGIKTIKFERGLRNMDI